jgi:pimeloyl-ACP methyl ester carboxylesterase
MEKPSKYLFYENTTPEYIWRNVAYYGDEEPAGVYVDMYFGKDRGKHNGHWVDPQTLYDYSENLDKITVPFLAIAGDEDPQDPSKDIYKCYENVSSNFKEFYTFPKHSHMDLLLGDDCRELIFPKIDNFMNEVAIRKNLNR